MSCSAAFASPTDAPAKQASPRLQQAFRLGIATYQPTADIVALDYRLRHTHLTIAEMEDTTAKTRVKELDGYRAAIAALKVMGAPDTVLKPYVNAVIILQRPLVISDNAKAQVPGDSVAQKVWSTLDEADHAAPDDGGTLAAWLKLSHGSDSLWAYHLGNLTCVTRAGIGGSPANFPLVGEAGALLESAPATTPQPLLDALKKMADQNKRHKIYPNAVDQLSAAANTVFG